MDRTCAAPQAALENNFLDVVTNVADPRAGACYTARTIRHEEATLAKKRRIPTDKDERGRFTTRYATRPVEREEASAGDRDPTASERPRPMSSGNDRRDAVIGIADLISSDTLIIYRTVKDIVRNAEAGDCDVAPELTLVERIVSRLQANLDKWKREGLIPPQTDEQVDRALTRNKARHRQAARERREREREIVWASARDSADPWAPFLEHLERTKAKP
jgi:hypothetical protein